MNFTKNIYMYSLDIDIPFLDICKMNFYKYLQRCACLTEQKQRCTSKIKCWIKKTSIKA